MVGAPLLSDAQTGPGGLGIAGGRWACQVAARPSTAHVNPTSGSPGKPSTPPPKGPATLALPSKHSGGFATIDPRHAGDTPQRSAYGSNSPQATNKDKPHHHDKHTKTCRRRPTPPHHLRHRQQPHPLKHPKHPMSPRFHRGGLHFEQALGRFTTIDPSTGTRRWPFRATTGGFATIDHRHADDTPQRSAYGSNSPQATNKDKPHHHNKHTKTCRIRPTQPPKGHTTQALPSNHGGFCDHRPPTRRRHAATQRLW